MMNYAFVMRKVICCCLPSYGTEPHYAQSHMLLPTVVWARKPMSQTPRRLGAQPQIYVKYTCIYVIIIIMAMPRSKIVAAALDAPDKYRIAIGNFVGACDKDDIWCNFTNKNKLITSIIEAMPHEKQIELLREYVSSDVDNLEKFLKAMKLSKLRKVHTGISGTSSGKKKSEIQRIRQYESTLTGNATLRDVDNMADIFFQQQADQTHNDFMNRFQRIHNGGTYPASDKKTPQSSGKTTSIIPARIVNSVQQPPDDIPTKNILEHFLIENETDYRVWKRIIRPAPDLVRKIEVAIKEGNYASPDVVKKRLVPFLTAFDYSGLANIADAKEKCRILENEIILSRKENQSYEFRTTVFILYKILNLNKPHVKLLGTAQ